MDCTNSESRMGQDGNVDIFYGYPHYGPSLIYIWVYVGNQLIL